MINCTENFKKNTNPYFSDKLTDLVILKLCLIIFGF